jgi:hypothetical protein
MTQTARSQIMNIKFVASLLFLACVCGLCPAQDDSAPTPGNNRFESGTNQAAVDARNQRTLANIEKAISVLIPGGIQEGTPRKEKLAAIIESYANGQARDAMDSLEKLTAEDSNLPPAQILMAGLTLLLATAKLE